MSSGSTPASVGERLRSEDRLRRTVEFEEVMSGGRRGVSQWLVAFRAGRTGAEPGSPRVGVIASRRVGGAVTRNRAKRRLRELYRRSGSRPAGDLVLVARPGIAEAPWKRLTAAYTSALERAQDRRRPKRRPRREEARS